MTKDRVLQTLFDIIDHFNQQRDANDQLEKSVETILSGEGGQLDSLGLINLIVAVEQKMEDEFHSTVILTDIDVLSSTNGPLHTIGSLASYLLEKINA
ncbi:hypothetical protein ACFL5M_00860 [Candidatus Neomarinimicrobiota bacterium]